MSKNKSQVILKEVWGVPVLFLIDSLSYALPILVYVWKLGWLSDSTDQWGQFGDFVGGVINPTIGLITIWFLAASLKQSVDSHSTQMDHAEKVSDFDICIALISYYEKSGHEFLNMANSKRDGFELMAKNRLATLGDSPEDEEIYKRIQIEEASIYKDIKETQAKAQIFFDLSDELKQILGRQHTVLKNKYISLGKV